jgi:hypothetical protein
MKFFKLALILCFPLNLAWANNCKIVTIDNCSYTDCRVQLAGYTQKIAILSPKEKPSNLLQYHFHGFRFNNNYSWQFDRSLDHVIQGFQLQRSVCGESPKILIIPYSEGQNSDYRGFFTNSDIFNQFHNAVLDYLKLSSVEQLHLSAHSGGGKTVSMIAAGSALNIKKISIYDGIYGQSWSDDLLKWARKAGKKHLKLVAVAPNLIDSKNWQTLKGADPFKFSRALLTQNAQTLKITQEQKGYVVRSRIEETVTDFFFEANTSSDHYTIVTHWWE